MSHQQDGVQNHNILTAKKSCEKIVQLLFGNNSNNEKSHSQRRYKQIKCVNILTTIQSKIFIFPPRIKNLNIKISKTTILLVVLHSCATFPLTPREKYMRLRMFEKRMC
jgi:hypothetical protein